MTRTDTRLHDSPSDEPEQGNESYDVMSAPETSVPESEVSPILEVERTIYDDGHIEISAAPGADLTATVTKDGTVSFEVVPETGSGADLKIIVSPDGTVSFTAVPEVAGSSGKDDDLDESLSEVEAAPDKTGLTDENPA
jgi:hypothetical protein